MTEIPTSANLTPDTPLQVRPLARSQWFRMDNVVFDRFGELIGATALGVYAGLCRYAHNQTQQCYPSAAHLAQKLRLTVEEIAACLEQLQAVGLIYIRHRPGACPLITLLDPRTTEPVVPMPIEPAPAPAPEPCPPVDIEKSDPVACKEDLQEDLEEEEKKTKFLSVSLETEEREKNLVLRAREMSEEPPALDPCAVSPYELTVDTRETQCAHALEGVRALLAHVWRTEETRQGQENAGCDHEHVNALGACTACGEVRVPASAHERRSLCSSM